MGTRNGFEIDSRNIATSFYRDVLDVLLTREVEILVGGTYAFHRFTDVSRETRDLDLFLRERDLPDALTALHRAGYVIEMTYPHWLAKVYDNGDSVDLIYRSGNGVSQVDDEWFSRAVEGHALGHDVQLCPVEEMIWTKAFIMERERFDGADVIHLIRSQAAHIDWERLVHLFGEHWRVLHSHIVLFGFVYPSHRNLVPLRIQEMLLRRLEHELRQDPPPERICQGTLLSRAQYLDDVTEWRYQDARLHPGGSMTAEDIRHWTLAINDEAATPEAQQKKHSPEH